MGGSYGPARRDGVQQYFSSSSLTAGDPNQTGGCARRWYYKYVEKRPEPSTVATRTGAEAHSEIDHYLTTGEKALGRIVMAGAHLIPEPNPSYLVEHEIDGGLLVAGIRFVGKIDLVDPRIDPSEVTDWKTTSSIAKWAKTGQQLIDTIQMPAYGQYALNQWGGDRVRLSHVYFQTRGRACADKRTILVPAETISRRWEQIESVARNLIDVGKETDAERVPANTGACGAYRGCPHRNHCSAANEQTLETLFGKGGSMSLLDKLQGSVAPKSPSTTVPAGFLASVQSIELAGRGFPALGGHAAKVYAAAKEKDLQGAGYAGSGELGQLMLMTVPEIVQLAQELAAEPKTDPIAKTEPADLLPPDAPASNPPPKEKPPGAATGGGTSPAPKTPATKSPLSKMKKGELIAEVQRLMKEAATGGDTSPAPTTSGVTLYVDCIPSVPFESLDSWVDALCDTLAKQYDAVDIRCAPDQSPLAYGKWRGAISALAKQGALPDGVYVLDTRGREIAETVADAVRGRCAVYVRGIR